MNEFDRLIEQAVAANATDIHLAGGHPPILRIHGELKPMSHEPLTPERIERLVWPLLDDDQRRRFFVEKDLDFSTYSENKTYYRINLHIERGHVAATVRIMPKTMMTRAQLGLPPVVEDLVLKRKGLILIVGSAGSGKTTTMNYIISRINEQRRCKIITIEDPIEYYHESRHSLIIQREVGSHTKSFSAALKSALRQDPDVVVIGEMRDLESISMALTTAETGHLVLTTLHAMSAVESINRIIDVYPEGKQNQVRVQLAESLIAIIGQTLIPSEKTGGRVLASEVLIPTLPIRNIIRRGALTEIRGQMEAGADVGMYTIEQCLSVLVQKGFLSRDVAKEYARYPNLLTC